VAVACGVVSEYVLSMGAPVWGTFSVRDHCVREAYLREVLLFDRLVIPYPDQRVEGERERWSRPRDGGSSETWDPERLDALLSVLGTQEVAGYNGARLAQLVPWSPHIWHELRSRLGAANALTGNPFMDTRLGLVLGREQVLPGVIEAVAAYPTKDAWRDEVGPTYDRPSDLTAAQALVALSRPLLLPNPSEDELDTLRRAVDVAINPDYVAKRAAYFDWFRDLIKPLRTGDAQFADVRLDRASLDEAERQLRELWVAEQRIVRRADKARMWTRVEVGCVTLGAAGSVGLACQAALPVIGAGAGLLAFAGWAIAKWQAPQAPFSLGGASMFVEARRRLGWNTVESALK
jgi:hypothetical protein